MIKHFDVVQRFQNRAVNLDNIDFDKEEDRILVLVMAIKCGDIGHHAKDLDLHIKWSTLAAEELFKQGDQEREQGLNVSIYCDRDISNMVKTNIGIIKNICLPLYEIWSYYLKSNEINECVIVHAKENLAYWQSCCKDRTNTTALKYFPLELKRQLILYQTERK
jgi:3'5'-cyclic nucleotide phosphodiesterase